MTLEYTGSVSDLESARQRRTRTFIEIDGIPVLSAPSTMTYYPLGAPLNDDPRQPLIALKRDCICDDDIEEHDFCLNGAWRQFNSIEICEESWLKRGGTWRKGYCLCHRAEEETSAEN